VGSNYTRSSRLSARLPLCPLVELPPDPTGVSDMKSGCSVGVCCRFLGLGPVGAFDVWTKPSECAPEGGRT